MVFNLMDTEMVINEVKVRECLWNPRNQFYKNKTDKYQAWEEVSEAVVAKYVTYTEVEKKGIVRAVQSRWKTARDAYMKCRLTAGRKPTYRSRLHTYIYQENLRFLEQVNNADESRARDEEGETSNSFTGDASRARDEEGETSNSFTGDASRARDEEGETSNSFTGDASRARDEEGETSNSFTGDASRAVTDDDGEEGSEEVMDCDIDIHDDFKNESATDGFSDQTVKYDGQLQCVAGTSSRDSGEEDSLATVDTTRRLRKRKIKSKMTEFETRLLKVLRLQKFVSSNCPALHADDQFFFNSLAPLINNYDSHQKLTFRSKVLEVMKEVENIDPLCVKQERETYVSD